MTDSRVRKGSSIASPYYEDEWVTLYHADCRDVLPILPPESVDLLLTDPPYGQLWESNRRQVGFGAIVGDDGVYDVIPALQDAIRVLQGRRHVYIFGRFDLSRLPLGGLTELVWDKGLTGPPRGDTPWLPSHEYVQFGVKANKAQRAGNTGNGPARLRRASVLHYQRLSGVAVTKHPTEKPIPLLREFIEASSHFGETVLDPFAGSGSTLEAARLEGRKAIGIEIQEQYCEIAAKRADQGRLAV